MSIVKHNWDKIMLSFVIIGQIIIFSTSFLPFINIGGNKIYYTNIFGVAFIISSILCYIFYRNKQHKLIIIPKIIEISTIVFFIFDTKNQFSINSILPNFIKYEIGFYLLIIGLIFSLLGLSDFMSKKKKSG